MNLLEINNLSIQFSIDNGVKQAVNNLSLEIAEKEIFCLIGESGSGKTVTALSLIGLITGTPGVVNGQVSFENKNLFYFEEKNGVNKLNMKSEKLLTELRGKRISIVFQEPVSSLSPYYTVGEQIAESLRNMEGYKNAKRDHPLVIKILQKVRFKYPDQVAKLYPHELSGGMAQRVMIAIALVNNPQLLIADEPTTSLDATIQLEILELLKILNQELKLSILLITHDINVASHYGDRIAVMLAGEIIEIGTKFEIFFNNRNHPYTSDLINSYKLIKKPNYSEPRSSLPVDGCQYYSRCPLVQEQRINYHSCRDSKPSFINIENDHKIKCWFYAHEPHN